MPEKEPETIYFADLVELYRCFPKDTTAMASSAEYDLKTAVIKELTNRLKRLEEK